MLSILFTVRLFHVWNWLLSLVMVAGIGACDVLISTPEVRHPDESGGVVA